MGFEKGNLYGKTSSRRGIPNKKSGEIREALSEFVFNEIKQLEQYKAKVTESEWLNFLKSVVPYTTAKLSEVEQAVTIEQDNDTKVHSVPFENWMKLLGSNGGNVTEAMEVYNLLTKSNGANNIHSHNNGCANV